MKNAVYKRFDCDPSNISTRISEFQRVIGAVGSEALNLNRTYPWCSTVSTFIRHFMRQNSIYAHDIRAFMVVVSPIIRHTLFFLKVT